MSNNSDSTPKKISNLKNVVLLLDCDVRKENGEVYLPDGTEMARLKKPEREQFKKNIKFTRTMTEKNVEEELRCQFPILRNYGRLSCASAANRGTRLEFHYSPRTVWDGTKINKHIRGNSALYVLFERTPESVHERPESPPVDSSLQQLQTPTPKPMGKLKYMYMCINLQRLKRKHDSSSSCVLEVVQNTGASVKKQVLEATSCPKGSKEGGQQSHQEQGDHSAGPTTGLLFNSGTIQQTQNPQIGLKQSSGEDHSKDSQEVRRSVDNNSSLDSAYESTSGDASGVDDNTEHSIGKTEEAASSHIRDLVDYLKDSQIDPTEGSSLDEISLHRVATGDQGGTEFVIFVNVNGIPENLSSLRAIFKGVGVADLTPFIESAYTGLSPASKNPGKVAVTVGSLDGSWNSPDKTEFEYHPNIIQDLQELISKMPHTKRNIPLDNQTLNPSRSARTVCSPSSLSSMVDRPLMADASEDILSLKALQCILFAAAATNDRECIEVIFSTSAGEAVFQTYRNSSILPEDIARARGHQNLAEYLQNVHKRLSEEIVCNVQTVTIDWVELKRATARKDIC
ncbi:unnamed protein product [Pocillopora meandrina]|uniref:Uncharacterized protein n=1 Tax=Pocillopora meandrina TaxID=46732 RepID=A0AAU9XN71_9CNID|nr:unnamed protein product [Pocillopora meandrina]